MGPVPSHDERIARAKVIRDLLRDGWRPPPMRDDQADRLLDSMHRMRGNASLALTPHEQRILDLIAKGNTGPQIAATLGRSPETIKGVEKQIRRKLGARTNAHAVALDRDG